MNKRILAVGNGDEMLEATPYGVVRWFWDPRQKIYSPSVEDWGSSYGQRLKESGITKCDVYEAALKRVETSVSTGEMDDLQATYDAAGGRGGYG